MKFFTIDLVSIVLSNCLSLNLACLYDAQDIPEPFRQLYFLCSIHHSQLPKNAAPNISSLMLGTPAVANEMSDLSSSSQEYLCSKRVDIQCAYEYDPCSQHLSIFGHLHYHKSAPEYLGISLECHLLAHGNDIWSPKQYDNSNYLLNVNCFGTAPFSKGKLFIETKVTAMKLQGFNLK